MRLEDLKKRYAEEDKKYKLPSFVDLNKDFEIYKAGKDADCLLRSVRKVMMDKVVNAMGFLEMFLTAANVPRMYLHYLKTMTTEDRASVDVMYNKLAALSIMSLQLELEYSEKGEAELIKSLFKVWQDIKPGFKKLLANIQKPTNDVSKKERSYFG